MLLAVSIITYKRPKALLRLLSEIKKTKLIKYSAVRIKIVVVDNDETASAKEVCDQQKNSMSWPLEYHIEPQRGIPSARNAALRYAGEETDFIVFIDDDEVPEPDWLDELLSVQEKYGADAVVGPVVSRFEGKVPDWVIKGNFYQRKRNKTGSQRKIANTGNVLFSNKIVRKEKLAFDNRFALTGASDEFFFQIFTNRGYSIIWADDAVVYEYVPQSRIGLRWLVQRSYRHALCFTFIQMQINPGIKIIIVRMLKGIGRILQGSLIMAISIFKGYHVFVSGARFFAIGCGTFAALFGFQYKEYKKIHGT